MEGGWKVSKKGMEGSRKTGGNSGVCLRKWKMVSLSHVWAGERNDRNPCNSRVAASFSAPFFSLASAPPIHRSRLDDDDGLDGTQKPEKNQTLLDSDLPSGHPGHRRNRPTALSAAASDGDNGDTLIIGRAENRNSPLGSR